MKLSNTFITLSIGLVAAGPLAIRNPQNSSIPTQYDAKPQDAKPAAVAESPMSTAANEQKRCDCSKPFRSSGRGDLCDDGYKNTSFFWGAGKDCTQLNCPEEEFNTQCDAKP
ncbi:hypothetical protein ARSEF4850_009749 [Beauveria asiatica]